jgi:hypothetical protein
VRRRTATYYDASFTRATTRRDIVSARPGATQDAQHCVSIPRPIVNHGGSTTALRSRGNSRRPRRSPRSKLCYKRSFNCLVLTFRTSKRHWPPRILDIDLCETKSWRRSPLFPGRGTLLAVTARRRTHSNPGPTVHPRIKSISCFRNVYKLEYLLSTPSPPGLTVVDKFLHGLFT